MHAGTSSLRGGFTLVELLIAMAIFTFGVIGVFGLFLGGVKARVQADTLIRCSLGTQNLVEDIRLDAVGGRPVNEYLGDGFVANGQEDTVTLRPYAGFPGLWYVVERAEDAVDPPQGVPTAIRLTILAITLSLPANTTISLQDLQYRELRWLLPPGFAGDPQQWFRDELVARGVAVRTEAVVITRPTWNER